MEQDFNFEDMIKQMEYGHLYKTHPHFDKYPDYLKQALMTNEILQGRVKDKKHTKV